MIATADIREAPKLPSNEREWRDLLALIPNYDCYATAGEGDWFDPVAAAAPIEFIHECIRHIEGELAGQMFYMERWQMAFVGCLFGWKGPDGTRRYRTAFLEVAKKNGKTPLCAAIELFVQFCDDEVGQQNYCAAADREQAALLYRHVQGMVESEPELESRSVTVDSLKVIKYPEKRNYFKVLSSIAETKHGGTPHLVIVDELHAQKTPRLVDTLRSSMVSQNRLQSLLIYITTADYVRESICNEVYAYACGVRDGVLDDRTFLSVIYETLVDVDDWTDEAVWIKANPNLGVSVSLEDLRTMCEYAKAMPRAQNEFCRLHLNMQTDAATIWLPEWDECGGSVGWDELAETMEGRECYAGLDLASRSDFNAFVMVFPSMAAHEGEAEYVIVPTFWLPQGAVRMGDKRLGGTYAAWVRDGAIIQTDGNAMNYDFLRRDISALGERFNIKMIGVDMWGAPQLVQQLEEDGFECVEFRQGYKSMSGPSKELEAATVTRRLTHGGHPVLSWMAKNVTIEMDAAANIKPNKKESAEKIDGIVAAVMGIGLAMVTEPEKVSSLAEGLLVL